MNPNEEINLLIAGIEELRGREEVTLDLIQRIETLQACLMYAIKTNPELCRRK